MSAFIFRTFWPKMAVFGGKIGEGMVQCWPLMNFLLLGIVTSVPFLAQIAQDMRTWKCGQTDTRCDRDELNLLSVLCYML